MNLLETIGKIDSAFDVLKDVHTNLATEGRRVDKEISHHYHVLEMIVMNASQISKVTKSLRALLKNRREIKKSCAIIESALASHDAKVIHRSKRVDEYETEAKESFNRIMGVSKNG